MFGNKNFTVKAFFATVLLLIIAGCNTLPDFLKNAGETISEERILNNFTAIQINSTFNIEIQEDTLHKVIITGGKNLIPEIETQIKNDTLIIQNNNNWNVVRGPDERITIHVHVDNLRSIEVIQPCYITTVKTLKSDIFGIYFKSDISECTMNVECNTFRFWNCKTSTGKYEFSGTTNYAYFGLHHLGNLFANELHVVNGKVLNNSQGDSHVDIHNKMDVSILNSGNVYYYSSPNEIIVEEISSSGKLIKID